MNTQAVRANPLLNPLYSATRAEPMIKGGVATSLEGWRRRSQQGSVSREAPVEPNELQLMLNHVRDVMLHLLGLSEVGGGIGGCRITH